ncbi:hypothetical protein [Nonomuraea gerenzanensis]|uniref:Uncharacterized protein n=1 Tax=Nonomuraea gerenzanensis TaxID=93944 RepID=A0A1M4BKU5_9ACTN|nr:hypothetical protein [Nonomuraea gerenzanensis]UBU10033.1 hypothetical protein LCN96_37530 [Nonomuraea gerenzanensis]SAP16258.1 hypothetical protein BN4615_P10921 [Nonomuraea gerenzanensis]
MTTSRIPAVIDELVDRFRAAPALAGVKVLDGPLVTGSPLKAAICVGFDGDPTGDGQAADFAQAWASIGQKAKDETFTITCTVVVWSGSTAVRAARVRAFEVLAAAEDVLRGDPALGQPPPTISAVTSGALIQVQEGSGMQVRIPFQIAVQTRI